MVNSPVKGDRNTPAAAAVALITEQLSKGAALGVMMLLPPAVTAVVGNFQAKEVCHGRWLSPLPCIRSMPLGYQSRQSYQRIAYWIWTLRRLNNRDRVSIKDQKNHCRSRPQRAQLAAAETVTSWQIATGIYFRQSWLQRHRKSLHPRRPVKNWMLESQSIWSSPPDKHYQASLLLEALPNIHIKTT